MIYFYKFLRFKSMNNNNSKKLKNEKFEKVKNERKL